MLVAIACTIGNQTIFFVEKPMRRVIPRWRLLRLTLAKTLLAIGCKVATHRNEGDESKYEVERIGLNSSPLQFLQLWCRFQVPVLSTVSLSSATSLIERA